MFKIFKITYYPKFIDKISSFHKLTEKEVNYFNDIINDNFFIENFLRVSKSNYDYISADKIEIVEINDPDEINVIDLFLKHFENDFDLYNMIISHFEDQLSTSSFSDDDLVDTVNIIKIFKFELDDNKDEAQNILTNNPHLLEDDTISEFFKLED